MKPVRQKYSPGVLGVEPRFTAIQCHQVYSSVVIERHPTFQMELDEGTTVIVSQLSAGDYEVDIHIDSK